MISTAVMVGEITATDWANRVGSPRALNRSPRSFLDGAVGAGSPSGGALSDGGVVGFWMLVGLAPRGLR